VEEVNGDDSVQCCIVGEFNSENVEAVMNYTRAQIENDYAHRTSGVLERQARSVSAMHDLQRHEPPSVYGPGLAKLRAERGLSATPGAVVTDADGVAKPYTTALRRASEAQ
jgi:hypothetical protein